MAVTKIWAVKDSLQRVLDYAANPQKTALAGDGLARALHYAGNDAKTRLAAADMDGENVFTFLPPQKFALCIGSEGSGLSEQVRARAAYTVRIPMGEHTESLNAAVSAGILMYELKRIQFI